MRKLLTGKIVGGVSWAGLEAISSLLVSFVALLGIARLIGASEFGLGSLALGIVTMVGVVPQCLFHDALVRSPRVTSAHYDSVWTAGLLSSLLIALMCMAMAAPLAAFFREPRFSAVFLSLSITLIPDAAIVPLIAERRREMDFRLAALQYLAARSVGATCGVGCALAGLGVWSVVAQQWVTSLLSLTILLIYSPLSPKLRLEIDLLKPMIKFTSPIVVTQFLTGLGPSLILVYVARVGDLRLVGYWGLANRLVDVPGRIINHALYHVMLSHFAKVQEQRSLLGQMVRAVNVWLATIVFPGLILMVVIGPDIIEFLLGEAWLPAGLAVQILALGVIIRLRYLMDHVALNALGNSEIALSAYLLETVVILAALFMLSPTTLGWIALIKALQPIIGYCIIATRSVQMTGRSAATECLDLFLDFIMIATVGLIAWVFYLYLVDEALLLVLVASPIIAMITAVFMMLVLRPASALDAWSMMRARSGAGSGGEKVSR